MTDTRRLTQQTLYISGSTGGDEEMIKNDNASSWSSRLFSMFCGRPVTHKIFTRRDKMQVLVPPSNSLPTNVRYL